MPPSVEPVSGSGVLKNHTGPIRALAATARLSNLPSVLSNVMLGVVLVGTQSGVAFLIAAGLCLYLSGGFLNDWADRQWDAACRPERALPRGLFPPVAYLVAGMAMAACGLVAAAIAGWLALAVAAAIALCVVIYTWLHKKSAWSAVFMGLCRALLPVLGWSVIADSSLMPAALLAGLALFFHVAGISLLARSESLPQAAKWTNPARGCFAGSALAMWLCGFFFFGFTPASAFIGLLPYALWTGRCLIPRVGTAQKVAGLLAGIPLVDWMLLLPIHITSASLRPGDDCLTGICLWLPPLAFLAGKVLQRYAPAT